MRITKSLYGSLVLFTLACWYFIWPLLSGAMQFTWLETPYVLASREFIRAALRDGQLPLWNPLLGTGGAPGVVFSTVIWDYRLFMSQILPPSIVTAVDFTFIALAYFWSITYLLRIDNFAKAWCVLLGFICFFTLDFVGYFFPFQVLNSVYMALPLLVALVFAFETTPSARTAFLLSLIYVFSFHGTKIEISFQLTLFLGCLIFLVRLAKPGNSKSLSTLLFDRRNLAYMLIFGVGILVNFWQLGWIRNVISESGRARPHLSMADVHWFFRSFGSSTFIFLFLGLVCGQILTLFASRKSSGLKPINWTLALPILCLGVISTQFKLSWIAEDIYISKSTLIAFLAAFFLTWCTLVRRLWADKSPSLSRGFVWELPLLTVLILHFCFDNNHTFNWGSTLLEKAPQTLQVAFAVLPFFALLSSHFWLKRTALLALAFLYLLRAHIQLLILSVGAVWHIQRDSFIYSFFISVLIVLGSVKLIELVETALASHKRWVRLGFIAMISLLLPSFRTYYFNNREVFLSPKDDQAFFKNRLIAKVSEFAKTSPALAVEHYSIFPELMVPGALLRSGVRQIEFYDSGLPSNTKNFFAHYPGRRSYRALDSFRPECRMQFLWFPNNILRNTGCTLDERGAYYSQNIMPSFEPFAKPLLAVLGTKYIIDVLAPLDPHDFKEIPTGLFRNEDPNAPISIWENNKFNPSAAAFVEFFSRSPENCAEVDHELGIPVNFTSNYFNEPVMKSSYTIALKVSGPGCLKIRVTNSPLWKIYVNGEPVAPLSESMFTVLPLKAGDISTIRADYFPNLKFRIAGGFVLLLVWCLFGPKLLRFVLASNSPKMVGAKEKQKE